MSEATDRGPMGIFEGYGDFDDQTPLMSETPGLIERMRSRLVEWDADEPREDWWNYKREYAEAAQAIRELVEGLDTLMQWDGARGCYDASKAYDAKLTAEALITKYPPTIGRATDAADQHR